MMGVSLRGEMRVLQEEDETESNKLIDLPILTKMKDAMGMASNEVHRLFLWGEQLGTIYTCL